MFIHRKVFAQMQVAICMRCIHICCSHHLEQVVRALLEAGAAVNSQNNEGVTALIKAAQSGHEQVHSSQLEYVELRST